MTGSHSAIHTTYHRVVGFGIGTKTPAAIPLRRRLALPLRQLHRLPSKLELLLLEGSANHPGPYALPHCWGGAVYVLIVANAEV
ncbi:hypothetical protein GN958_ATG01968 [Phytophthora infestans]|uniref:Uncharacterized protein n=1 Tax=Phytophthora infestans TaxID=4787 RepID=A0A8S9V779_PHYIN|nr:hypothetical protein GN958_ATG01968 [Phytophthora infestans]